MPVAMKMEGPAAGRALRSRRVLTPSPRGRDNLQTHKRRRQGAAGGWLITGFCVMCLQPEASRASVCRLHPILLRVCWLREPCHGHWQFRF